MFSQDDDGPQGAALTVVFALVAVVISAVIGVGVYKNSQRQAPPNATAQNTATAVPGALSATPPDAAGAALAASDAASVKVENGVVKFYFVSGKSDLAAGAGDALLDVVKGAKAGRKLVISGFHDATGDAGKNAELAKRRALAVRDALTAAGVTDQQIELKKPEQMTASGSNAEARRVEVALQ